MKNEDLATTKVEMKTREIPSLTFLLSAAASVALSAGLMAAGKERASLFVGQWAPTILAFAVYNKLVKTFSAPATESQRLKHGDHASPWKRADEGGVMGTQPLPAV